MLLELAVTDLGVLADLSLVLGPGTTALTGETGAGKTLVVTAIELLLGGRADSSVVRPGATEARVEGRFLTPGGDEVVLARVVPADGRSRAYVDGGLAPVARLAEIGGPMVDLHGQHAHQALLGAAAQRSGLDHFGDVDLVPLRTVRARLSEIDEALGALGGDPRSRAREADLLRFQVDEIEQARLDDPDEEARLEAQEEVLADAGAARAAAGLVHESLSGEGGAADAVAAAVAAMAGRAAFTDLEDRLRAVAAEVSEAAADARALAESLEEDPERLQLVQERRALLRGLRRKYGETLADVMAFGTESAARLAELDGFDERAATIEAERRRALEAEREAAEMVGTARRRAAPALAEAVEGRLRSLAMPRARLEVTVGDADPGDEVTFLLAANPGEPPLPLTKVASGGELARTMLALRLALRPSGHGEGRGRGRRPSGVAVFDEVDAGVGGEAALAVGRALADLGTTTQVLVVTHLPQVAAFADAQIAVTKGERSGRTIASARPLDDGERVVELSRMLSGHPESAVARDHAEELLTVAAQERGR